MAQCWILFTSVSSSIYSLSLIYSLDSVFQVEWCCRILDFLLMLRSVLIFSMDCVPFLMHDHTLRRTTDVRDVFPERQIDDASLFYWKDLHLLNAGQWFLKVQWHLEAEENLFLIIWKPCQLRRILWHCAVTSVIKIVCPVIKIPSIVTSVIKIPSHWPALKWSAFIKRWHTLMLWIRSPLCRMVKHQLVLRNSCVCFSHLEVPNTT